MFKIEFAGATISEVNAQVALYLSSAGNAIASATVTPGNATTTTPTDAPATGAATTTAPEAVATGERDAAGVVWDAARHASTKGTTKDGLWRMKVGVARPVEEGLPAAGTATAGASTTSAPAPAGTTAPVAAEEDEFAAWAGVATERKWTDTDLSALCNQAAQKAGGPQGVKEIITRYVPEGAQNHSKSIPDDKREAFAKEVETSHGITYGAA